MHKNCNIQTQTRKLGIHFLFSSLDCSCFVFQVSPSDDWSFVGRDTNRFHSEGTPDTTHHTPHYQSKPSPHPQLHHDDPYYRPHTHADHHYEYNWRDRSPNRYGTSSHDHHDWSHDHMSHDHITSRSHYSRRDYTTDPHPHPDYGTSSGNMQHAPPDHAPPVPLLPTPEVLPPPEVVRKVVPAESIFDLPGRSTRPSHVSKESLLLLLIYQLFSIIRLL